MSGRECVGEPDGMRLEAVLVDEFVDVESQLGRQSPEVTLIGGVRCCHRDGLHDAVLSIHNAGKRERNGVEAR